MTAPDGVLDLVRRWAAAEQRNDAGQLNGLLDGDFVGVGPLGFVLTREQWLARFGHGLVNRAFAIEDPQVRDHGAAAVAIGVLAQQTSWQGGDNSGRFRVSLVAVRSADRWVLASVHIGPLQAPAGPPDAGKRLPVGREEHFDDRVGAGAPPARPHLPWQPRQSHPPQPSARLPVRARLSTAAMEHRCRLGSSDGA